MLRRPHRQELHFVGGSLAPELLESCSLCRGDGGIAQAQQLRVGCVACAGEGWGVR